MKTIECGPRSKLIVGEALEALTLLEPGSIHALITDPPYSSGGAFRGDRMASTTEKYVQSYSKRDALEFDGDTRDGRGYAYWVALWLAKCREVCVPGAPVVLFTDWRQLPNTTDAIQAGGWVYRGITVRDKTEAARHIQGRFAPQCEYLVWGSNGPMALDRDAPTMSGCFRYPAPRTRIHPSQKPLALMRDVVRICERGGTVLDLFCGSGTTGVAAQLEGLGFVGVESNVVIAELAANRLRGQPAVVGSSTLGLFDGAGVGHADPR